MSIDGAPLIIGAARQRALLALLLLDANHRVTTQALIDGIWGEADPQHPDAAAIRRLFPAGLYGAMVSFEIKGWSIHPPAKAMRLGILPIQSVMSEV